MFLRNVLGAFAIIALSVGLVVAEPVKGRITKIGGGKLTLTTGKKGEEAKKTEYELAKDVKVVRKKGDVTEDVKGGVNSKAFQNIDEKGIFATVNVEGNKVTEIVLGGGKKKKKTDN